MGFVPPPIPPKPPWKSWDEYKIDTLAPYKASLESIMRTNSKLISTSWLWLGAVVTMGICAFFVYRGL